jgi:malate dehydrogenase
MTAVAIIGAGDIGGATASALAELDCVNRMVLIDPAQKAAAGKALDIQQSGAIHGFHTRLEATDDESRVARCDMIVIADRFGPPSSEWIGEEGLALIVRLSKSRGDAPVLFAGSSQAGLLQAAAREAGIERKHLIGSSPEALAAAVTAIVAMEARCSPKEINLTVLGAPERFVFPWSEASIGGFALERVLTQVQLARVAARAERLWPPGPYALGTAAARVGCAILQSSRRSFSVLTMLGGEFGVRNRLGVLPAMLSPRGIAILREPSLNTRERVQLETALGV